jgi:hypothetical protein
MTPGDDSPPPPPDGLAVHPDLDRLADLDAGLLDPAAAADTGRHAASCPRCRATLAAFVAVRKDLRTLAPPVLPAAVAARLDETVARLRAGATVPAEAKVPPPVADPPPAPRPVPISSGVPPRPPVVDLSETREQRRARARRLTGRVAASVIVAAALVGVGSAIVQKKDDGGTVSQSAAIPGQQEHTTSGGAGGGSDYGPKADSQPERTPGSIPPDAALPSYDGSSLLTAIPAIVSRSAVEIITRAGLSGPAGALSDSARRARCTASIPDTSGILIAVQRVVFSDQISYVLIYADASGRRSVVVVSSTCGDVPIPQVLYRHQG